MLEVSFVKIELMVHLLLTLIFFNKIKKKNNEFTDEICKKNHIKCGYQTDEFIEKSVVGNWIVDSGV